MTLFVRVYATEKKARDAAEKLKAEGFGQNAITILAPKEDEDALAQVASAVDGGRLPKGEAKTAVQDLQEGRTILLVDAPYGTGQTAARITGAFGPVRTMRSAPSNGKPRLTSEALGLPLLSSGRSGLGKLFGGELSSPYYRALGEPELKNDPAPLSGRFGWKVLSDTPKEWTQSFGQPLLSSKAYTFGEPQVGNSYSFGEPKLDSKKYSFGEPQLKPDPAPFSEKLGWSVLTK